jgi:hypothetical protein
MGTTHDAISGKVIFPAIIDFIGLGFGIQSWPGRKPLSCGPFSTRRWWSMNGALTSLWLPLLNIALFVSLTRANPSNITSGIVFKLGGRGDGPLTLCMNYVELDLATMIVLTGSKPSLGKGFLRSTGEKKNQNLHLCRGITL